MRVSESSGEARCVDDVCFPGATRIGTSILPLRGVAKKRYLIFDLYTAALYTNASTSDEVLADVPKKLVFRYLRSIDGADIIEAAQTILARNPNVNLSSIQSRLDQANSYYRAGVNEGDVYELEYRPGVGSTIRYGGKELGTIPGLDFAKAYFGIWLSNYSLSDQLRDALLGIQS